MSNKTDCPGCNQLLDEIADLKKDKANLIEQLDIMVNKGGWNWPELTIKAGEVLDRIVDKSPNETKDSNKAKEGVNGQA